jgi:bacillithiol system protein YtxJ
MVKSRIEKKPDPRFAYYLIDVIAHKGVSQQLSIISNTMHESPQAFLYRGGELLESSSHMAISASAFSAAADRFIAKN